MLCMCANIVFHMVISLVVYEIGEYIRMCVDETASATAEVSDQVVRVGQFLESFTVTCAIVLGEQLSRKKV